MRFINKKLTKIKYPDFGIRDNPNFGIRVYARQREGGIFGIRANRANPENSGNPDGIPICKGRRQAMICRREQLAGTGKRNSRLRDSLR